MRTRWNSSLNMIERILKIKNCLFPVLQDPISKHKYDHLVFSATEQQKLIALVDVLTPFRDATEQLSGEKYVTAAHVVPMFRALEITLAPKSTDSLFKERTKNILRKSLGHYMFKYKIMSNPHLLACTYLDPCRKKFSRFDDNIAKKNIQHAERFIRDYSVRHQIVPLSDSLPIEPPSVIFSFNQEMILKSTNQNIIIFSKPFSPVHKRPALQVFDFDVLNESLNGGRNNRPHREGQQLNQELNDYRNEQIYNKVDVMTYWRTNQKRLPLLSRVVKDLYCVPATTVPAERIFSMSGYIVKDRRSRLTSGRVDKMCVINDFIRKQN